MLQRMTIRIQILLDNYMNTQVWRLNRTRLRVHEWFNWANTHWGPICVLWQNSYRFKNWIGHFSAFKNLMVSRGSDRAETGLSICRMVYSVCVNTEHWDVLSSALFQLQGQVGSEAWDRFPLTMNFLTNPNGYNEWNYVFKRKINK